MQLERFDETVLKIHESGLDPARWRAALAAIADDTGSAGAVMRVIALSPHHKTYAHLGKITADQVAGYDAACGDVCPRQAYARANPGPTIRCDSLILSEREMDRDPVYDWFRRNGLRYFLGTTLARSEQWEVFFNVQRTRRQGHVQSRELELFGRFLPHLRHAIRVGGILGGGTHEYQLSQSLFHNLKHGAVLLDSSGQVLIANSTAEALARTADGLFFVEGRIAVAQAKSQIALDRLIRKAVSLNTGGGCQLERKSGRSPYLVIVSPVSPGPWITNADPRVLLLIVDPAAVPSPAPELLQALFGLTPTEGKVASLIATAAPTDNVAARLGMSPETARVHLKSIYRKARVSGRAELIAIVARLA